MVGVTKKEVSQMTKYYLKMDNIMKNMFVVALNDELQAQSEQDEYLEGNKGAFETLYNKYERKIQYFIYNIVKDYQRAEDITQDVFIYVMQNRIQQGYTFKYYIYLVAKSRAYNHINTEKKHCF